MKLKPADTAFSRYVRQRDADEYDSCECPLCDNAGHWKSFVCGHYIRRAILSTRWHEDNCHSICVDCNGLMESSNDLKVAYGHWIMQKIGVTRWNQLMKDQQSGDKYMQYQIDAIVKKYRSW